MHSFLTSYFTYLYIYFPDSAQYQAKVIFAMHLFYTPIYPTFIHIYYIQILHNIYIFIRASNKAYIHLTWLHFMYIFRLYSFHITMHRTMIFFYLNALLFQATRFFYETQITATLSLKILIFYRDFSLVCKLILSTFPI